MSHSLVNLHLKLLLRIIVMLQQLAQVAHGTADRSAKHRALRLLHLLAVLHGPKAVDVAHHVQIAQHFFGLLVVADDGDFLRCARGKGGLVCLLIAKKNSKIILELFCVCVCVCMCMVSSLS